MRYFMAHGNLDPGSEDFFDEGHLIPLAPGRICQWCEKLAGLGVHCENCDCDSEGHPLGVCQHDPVCEAA